MNLSQFITTDQADWYLHETYIDEMQAHAMMHFFKDSCGYSAVKVVCEPHSELVSTFNLYVLKTKGA